MLHGWSRGGGGEKGVVKRKWGMFHTDMTWRTHMPEKTHIVFIFILHLINPVTHASHICCVQWQRQEKTHIFKMNWNENNNTNNNEGHVEYAYKCKNLKWFRGAQRHQLVIYHWHRPYGLIKTREWEAFGRQKRAIRCIFIRSLDNTLQSNDERSRYFDEAGHYRRVLKMPWT